MGGSGGVGSSERFSVFHGRPLPAITPHVASTRRPGLNGPLADVVL